ncbi:sporozoite surface protein 2-like isoform X1 [Ostrinia furnacalis]|uniref:sporozoite surface protein 2-like isoform X1 n=1 Tax=Ostrinia furnacalis TaxID=93504 RepID=UPI00103BA2CD|nr:sporozoite surface protein 2-like isoform X1 [Ostrinia furnacalis]
MNAATLIAILGIVIATGTAITVTDPPPSESPFVPGVFIAADALKNLQDPGKSNNNGAENSPNNSKNKDQISSSPNMNVPEQSSYQQMPGQPMPGQQMPGQPMGNQLFMPADQRLPNQQLGYPNQPSAFLNQRGFPNQPMYNQPQLYGNPQGMLLMNQQPGFGQQNGGPQGILLNNPSFQQPMLLNQQPGYQNPQGAMFNQQPYNQQPMLGSMQQPSGPLLFPNAQITQPNMVGNPNLVGQPTLIANNPGNGALYANPGQSQGNLYAMIPVNAQNTMANPNLGNNNAYFVPVQQMPGNMNLLRDTADEKK